MSLYSIVSGIFLTLQDVDEIYFGRLVLLIALSLFVVGGAAAMFTFYILEPVYAGPQRTRYVTS